jgi:WD40 repeat protein
MTGVYTVQGEKLYALPLDPITIAAAAAWSADGSKLATSNGSLIQLWNAADGELLASLRGHTGSVSSLSWSPDGSRLVSSSAFLNVGASDMFITGDRTVRIWDVENQQELYQMLVPPGGLVTSALWSPDGKYLLTTDADQDITKIWRIWANLEDLKAYAKICCLARPLVEEERAAYGLK